ncbi:NAD(P)-dependent oxidoreductase [Phytohabitans sp. ZYX-F-186]|uniref:NAD(P)-dependent oxidoreductase n=1 Tax=Phytohabitans maris TaxID=3071409 RepID=A0ABU0Z9D6_9ACTN|nr:NAD(P)-dependent oxidoreductase [Phytohabitans sp. ZYX-F-186]MDQ7902945.1 NAD(P)-dependent oxidoreductase [Phytohabitans sp. ZYX-F-186]
MRTLITGPTGRVGSRYVRRQLDLRRPVRVLVRSEAQVAPWWNGGAEVTVGDLREPDTAKRALEGVEAVVHIAAAFRGVPDAEAYAVNRDATIALAQAAVDAGVARFVFVSTNLVYGPGRGRPAGEGDEPRPAGAYPVGKAAAEVELLRLHRERGLPVRIARLAFVYGDGDPHLAESVAWARRWAPHRRLHLVHHADVAQALDRILAAEGVDGQVFNVADDAPVTALELLRANQEEPDPEAATRRLDDPWEGIVDTCRIRTQLGYRPLYPTLYTAQAAGAL